MISILVPKSLAQDSVVSNNVLSTPNNKTEFGMNIVDLQMDADDFLLEDSLEKRLQFRQRRGPCSCVDLNCGCCAGMFRRKRKFNRPSSQKDSFKEYTAVSFVFTYSLFEFHIRPK